MVRITRVGRQSKGKALTFALDEGTQLNRTRSPRPHAPRFDPLSNPILFAPLIPLNSVPHFPATAIHCARVHRSSSPIAARLARIPPCVAEQIPCSLPNHRIGLGRRISPRQGNPFSSHEVMSASVASSDSNKAAPYRAPRSTERRSIRRLDSAQTASTRSTISGIGSPNCANRPTAYAKCNASFKAIQPGCKALQGHSKPTA
jgi:hypothetical protein